MSLASFMSMIQTIIVPAGQYYTTVEFNTANFGREQADGCGNDESGGS